jgi:hypothetical protein
VANGMTSVAVKNRVNSSDMSDLRHAPDPVKRLGVQVRMSRLRSRCVRGARRGATSKNLDHHLQLSAG